MAWIKVESCVARHRKFLAAGPAASWLWLCGLAYCQEGLTDGFIPCQALPLLGPPSPHGLKAKLVAVGLWDEVDGGWRVHDYLEHNHSASYVGAIRSERRVAGARGGVVSGEARRSKQTVETNTEANHEANPKQTSNPAKHSNSIATATRSAPLIARRRLDAAWEGPKGLYVPQRKHSDFIQLRNHPGAEAELWAWYGEVADAWQGSPGADMLKFWTARFEEKWPALASTAEDRRLPAWARSTS